MWKLIKVVIGIIVLPAIEAFFYFYYKPRDLEMFFMIWIFISLALILYNIFNVKSDYPKIGMDSQNQPSSQLTISFLEQVYGTAKGKTRSFGGLLDPMNIFYLFFIVANIIGYIAVMPK